MKNSIYLMIVAMFFTVFAFSQNNVGISAGLNFANISQSGFDNSSFNGIESETFGTFGILYKRELDKNWSIVSGLNYARRGAQTLISEDLEVFDRTFEIGAKLVHRMDYLEVPALFEYRFKGNDRVFSPYIFAGPMLSYESGYNIAVKAHVLVDINLFDYDVNISNGMFNRWDLAGVAGAGLSFPAGRGNINIDARYVYGFTDILDNPIIDLNLKHRNIRVGATYFYNF